MTKKIFLLFKLVITDPSQAAADLTTSRDLRAPALIALAYCAAYAGLLFIKPANFPAEYSEAVMDITKTSFTGYFAAQILAGPAFSAIFSGFAAIFSKILNSGRLLPALLLSAAGLAIAAGWAVKFKDSPFLLLPLLLITGLAAAGGARTNLRTVLSLFKFALASCAIPLLFVPAYLISVARSYDDMYITLEAAAGLWILIAFVKAVKTIFGGTAPRQTLSVLFSMCAAFLFFYLLKNTGLMSPEMFRLAMLG